MSVRVSLGCDIYRAQHRRAECSLSASEDFKADSPNSRLYLWTDLSKDEEEYYDWKRVWESQNLHNGLFSTHSDPSNRENPVDLGKPWQSLDLGNISSDGSRECESGNSRVCCNTTSDHKLLELSEHLRRPGVEQEETSDSRSCDVFE